MAKIGELATFSFHKYRKNEIAYDVENINSYSQPVYFEIFNLLGEPINQ